MQPSWYGKTDSGPAGLRRRPLLAGLGALLSLPALAHKPHLHKPIAPPHPASTNPTADEDAGSGPASAAGPATTPLGPVDTVAREACIIDYATGATLMDRNADAPMTPSSLTKLMTAYLTFTALAAGKITLAQQFPVSEKAWRMGGSKMFVPYPGAVAVEDLIRGMIIQSGNDACIVLAEGIAGSEDAFVLQMNAAAAKLGLTHSVFKNCTGWPDPGHVMSARDIATLARHLIGDFPQYYHYFSEKDFVFNNIRQGNRNTLVDKGIADGLKTGHTEEGGFGECSSATRNGRRVIVVLNGMGSMSERAHESERLLDWALDNFTNAEILAEGAVLDQVPVYMGRAATVPLIGSQTVTLTLPLDWKRRVKVDLSYPSPVPAPIRKGQPLGTLRIAGAGPIPLAVPLLAGADVPSLGVADRAMRVLARYLGA